MSWGHVLSTLLGGLVAGLVGVFLFLYQRNKQIADAKEAYKREYLVEFREALMPLLIELDRWRYQPDQVWVGSSRWLPDLNTWIYDPQENATKAPDWESIGRHAQKVERLWRDRLADRINDRETDALWNKATELLFHLTRPDGADPRSSAEQAQNQIQDLLAAIKPRSIRRL